MNACCEARERLDKAVAWLLRMKADGFLVVAPEAALHRLGWESPPRPEPYQGWDAGLDPPDIIGPGRTGEGVA